MGTGLGCSVWHFGTGLLVERSELESAVAGVGPSVDVGPVAWFESEPLPCPILEAFIRHVAEPRIVGVKELSDHSGPAP